MDNYSHRIDEKLRIAYQQTNYFVPELDISIKIDLNCKALEDLLQACKLETWAFITACNPRSVSLSDLENQNRQKELKGIFEKGGLPFWGGVGIGMDSDWEPEESFLVLGISKEEAMKLGQQLHQNAIVFGRKGGQANLIWLSGL